MTDSEIQSNSSVPLRETPWTTNRTLVEKHPELHHYTTRAGLEGIWTTNSLWATHFSRLSDSSEIVLLKDPLIAALEAPVRREIIKNQHDSLRLRRFVKMRGGVSAYAHEAARKFVDAIFASAFTGAGVVRPMAEPFISSFCSHANDHQYEQANGLLSQWRGYGVQGRYALVFDTQRLDHLLAREWQAHFWLQLELSEAIYLKGLATLETSFPKLLEKVIEQMSNALQSDNKQFAYFIETFLQAATLLKHRGFEEEREVRIVAIPHSKRLIEDARMKDFIMGRPPLKEVRTLGESKKYVALFESLDAELPIKRIIVGPGAKQEEDIEFACSLVSNRVPIWKSETPFIG